jgi:hypothetical protein
MRHAAAVPTTTTAAVVKCGTTTVVAPAFEEGQRAFVVRCPACGRAGTYSLIIAPYASGEPDHGAASVGGIRVSNFVQTAAGNGRRLHS